jgi:pimeloyl-ACP methyl ester carboxylesterase
VGLTAEQDWTFGGTWPYEPKWLSTDGVRLHYVDEGPREGEPVVMLHGNPTWAYLYRHFIATLAEAGFRAVAHDELGFGRSDKPESVGAYSLARHVAHFRALIDELTLDGVTLVVQDWGGPIGLAWAVEQPERVRRLVLLNTWPGGTPPDHPEAPRLFKLLRSRLGGPAIVKGANVYVRFLLRDGERELDEQARAAYLAPHPSRASRAGMLAYARMIPWNGGNPAGEIGRRTEAGLGGLAAKPVLIVWPLGDRAFKKKTLTLWRARFPEAEVHELEGAGHYLQEDAHERVVPLLLDFLRRT